MAALNPQDILEYPVSTEKAIRGIEADNTLLFIVNHKATKAQIKWAIQKEFGVKVVAVRTLINPRGKKKAFIKLDPETPAIDVTSKLGMV